MCIKENIYSARAGNNIGRLPAVGCFFDAEVTDSNDNICAVSFCGINIFLNLFLNRSDEHAVLHIVGREAVNKVAGIILKVFGC